DSYLKLRSDFLREFKSTSAYVPAIVSRPRKSDYGAHRLLNKNTPTRLISSDPQLAAFELKSLSLSELVHPSFIRA
ncbi:hypothetical protein, partial [Lactiplantibacillus pentosus]|uniref:hypothetical protein n=1 Tax=Lactiplantibacillus pentosus TaxID=1589 RepID=UPI0021A50001